MSKRKLPMAEKLKLPQIPEPKTLGRSCGACTVCCTYFAIPALNKPALTPCSNLKDKICNDGMNCTIYADRPSACSYNCMWIYGYGAEEDRPDISGVVIDNAIPIDNALRAIPLSDGAQDTPKGRLAVDRISRDRKQPILVCSYPERYPMRFVGRGVE